VRGFACVLLPMFDLFEGMNEREFYLVTKFPQCVFFTSQDFNLILMFLPQRNNLIGLLVTPYFLPNKTQNL